jgi:hypothetical protein
VGLALTGRPNTNGVVRLEAGRRRLPVGDIQLRVDASRFRSALTDFGRLLLADQFRGRGLSVRIRSFRCRAKVTHRRGARRRRGLLERPCDYVESELIVRSYHSCLNHPAVIEEVRRILHENLEDRSLAQSTHRGRGAGCALRPCAVYNLMTQKANCFHRGEAICQTQTTKRITE